MYAGAIAGMYLCGMYGALMILGIIFGGDFSDRTERFCSYIITLILVAGFGYFWYGKNHVLTRQPVISSCVSVGNKFEMVDSTLRCKNGEEPRYTVIKPACKMEPNEQTPCKICGKIMIHHYDVSCTKTDADLEAARWIDYMNDPL